MKNPNDDIPLEQIIPAKYKIGMKSIEECSAHDITYTSSSILQYSERLHSEHEIEKREQPDRIADALERCKEQMSIRENYKPEYFIWSLELKEDDKGFGFVRQTEKNRLTKFAIDLSFKRASDLLKNYFNTKVSIASTDITGLSKKEQGNAA